MSFLTIIMLLSWFALLYWANLKMSVVIAALITLWCIAAEGHNNGSNLLFYIWLFFMGLAILDVIQSKGSKTKNENHTEEKKQNSFNTWLASYKHHVDNCNNEDSES